MKMIVKKKIMMMMTRIRMKMMMMLMMMKKIVKTSVEQRSDECVSPDLGSVLSGFN